MGKCSSVTFVEMTRLKWNILKFAGLYVTSLKIALDVRLALFRRWNVKGDSA